MTKEIVEHLSNCTPKKQNIHVRIKRWSQAHSFLRYLNETKRLLQMKSLFLHKFHSEWFFCVTLWSSASAASRYHVGSNYSASLSCITKWHMESLIPLILFFIVERRALIPTCTSQLISNCFLVTRWCPIKTHVHQIVNASPERELNLLIGRYKWNYFNIHNVKN